MKRVVLFLYLLAVIPVALAYVFMEFLYAWASEGEYALRRWSQKGVQK